MSFSPEQINRVAHLARLAMDDAEAPKYARELSRIVEMVARVAAVDTKNIEPLWHPGDMTLRMRDDLIDQSGDLEALNNMAPATDKGLYLVPKVIK